MKTWLLLALVQVVFSTGPDEAHSSHLLPSLPEACEQLITAQEGDTIASIAKDADISVIELLRLNIALQMPGTRVIPGQKICIKSSLVPVINSLMLRIVTQLKFSSMVKLLKVLLLKTEYPSMNFWSSTRI